MAVILMLSHSNESVYNYHARNDKTLRYQQKRGVKQRLHIKNCIITHLKLKPNGQCNLFEL